MSIIYCQGNILEANVVALVNPVNTVGVMGKGLALQFKHAFPDNFTAYKRACDAGHVHIGTVFVYRLRRSATDVRYIMNFPTKQHWRQPSILSYIQEGLKALTRAVERHTIHSIAIPPLGCGLGGLSWDEVCPCIVDAMGGLPAVRSLIYTP